MLNLFSFTGKRVSVSISRSSYLTYQSEQKRLTVADKKKSEILMRTRTDKVDGSYIKILPRQDRKLSEQEMINDIPVRVVNKAKEIINPYKNNYKKIKLLSKK